MTKYFMQSKLFESILKEAKDYKFKAKVGDFWLQKDGKGWRLCDDKAEADEFESETEPKQIINQMQKDGEVKETAEIEIVKIKESTKLFNRVLKEAEVNTTFKQYFDLEAHDWNTDALRARFKDICNKRGIWTDLNEGCEVWGFHLAVGRYRDGRLGLEVKSPYYYLDMNYGGDIEIDPDYEEELNKSYDDFIINAINKSCLFIKSKYSDERNNDSRKYLLIKNNPNPKDLFVVDKFTVKKLLRQAFKSDECKFISFDDQYDIYGETWFEVSSPSESKIEIYTNFYDEKSKAKDATYVFDKDLNFTVSCPDGTSGSGHGYEEAVKWYILNVANVLAEGEYAKDYNPNTYEFVVYLRQDFYTRISKNIWQPIESIFENNGRRNTNYQPEDWVDERAAAWTCVEEDDVKDAVAWLRKKKVKNPIKFSIRDENGHDVTDQF